MQTFVESVIHMRRIQHKFRAVQTERDGHKFPSQLEARYYDQLKLAERSGDLLFFLRQVPFHFPGGGKYVVDYQEFWSDGSVVHTDVKGMETPEFKFKKKLVESIYPIKINIVKKC